MGTNMMRQAVPLLRTDAPIVGTGLEPHVAKDSRTMINAEGDGIVTYVYSQKISIKYNQSTQETLVSYDDDTKDYFLTKFQKPNQRSLFSLDRTGNSTPFFSRGWKIFISTNA